MSTQAGNDAKVVSTNKRYEVTLSVKVVVIMDETLVPDDAYRRDFYDHKTQADLAGHIAYTVVRGFSYVEGLTPEEHKLIRSIETNIDVEDVKQVM